eukprot:245957-Hanusia_phi.AAC.1
MPSVRFAQENPIDFVVEAQRRSEEQNASSFTCLMEACSGSGKSLSAAEYFVRNPDKCLYFLFDFVHTQRLYQAVKDITFLVNLAIDFDVSKYVHGMRVQKDHSMLPAVDIAIDRSKWHVLGVLGYLLNQTSTVVAVSTEEASKWARGLWILLDEAIPREAKHCAMLSPIARLVFFKR